MIVVIDTNILFSALIRDSTVRKLILDYEDAFLIPYYIFEELLIHRDQILTKSGIGKAEFDDLLMELLSKVSIVTYEELIDCSEAAIALTNGIDLKDAPFVACALAFPGSVIWSDDKALKRIRKIRVLSTEEMISLSII
jgi:predicted nucleic acid-binding protein